MLKRGLNHNATRAQGYNALTTKRQRSIITFAISVMIFSKSKFIASSQRLKLILEEVAPSRTNLQKHFSNTLYLLSTNIFKAFFQNSKLKSLKREFKNSLFLTPFIALFMLFSGCSKPLVKIQTQEVFIPVKCDLELPQKPLENGSFESHRALAIYYKQVEQIARDCTKH